MNAPVPPYSGAPFPQQPAPWGAAPPARSKRAVWFVLAGVLAVALIAGIGVAVYRSMNRPVHLDPMQRAFPELVPREQYSGTGFQGFECTWAPRRKPLATLANGPALPQHFDSWDYAWGCVDPGGQLTFTVLQFTGSSEIESALATLDVRKSPGVKEDGISYTNYAMSAQDGRPYVLTAFPTDPERNIFLIMTYGSADFEYKLEGWIQYVAPLG
ncbi:hypothetical protein ACFVMC_05130 [Nocardia sp. NPDC127579]|uniref:hypothetical protein n=1 Tax=Nocardia sp. NPDC127579 TaxID=3345402 RepID=UPI00362B0A60